MESSIRLTPAATVIRAFQGVRPTARLIGCDMSSVSRWQVDGLVPAKHQRRILELAYERQIDLTAYDLIYGRPSA